MKHFFELSKFYFSLYLVFSASSVWAQNQKVTEKPSAPIPTQKGVQVQIPAHLRKPGTKLRVKNLDTGREAIFEVSDEEFIASDVVRSLLDKDGDKLIPEFSILDSIKKQRARMPAPTDPGLGGYRISKSLIFDQPVWRTVGYRTERLKNGVIKIEIDPKVRNIVISPDVAERRRSLREARGIRELFEAGWKALKAGQYNVSLEAFERVVNKKDLLKPEQISQAHLGKGISNFHQKGCDFIDEDFREADKDPKNYEDVSYYRALCFVEKARFDDAEGLFAELVKRQSASYLEASRFYLGVVAENKQNYDAAESAYLDTIDFANDQRIVELAKERLQLVRRLRAEANYQSRLVNFAATFGTGYDTNVIALPQGLSPSDYNVSNKASISYLGLGMMEIKLPFYGKGLDHKLRFSGLLMHYQRPDISTNYDIQSGDAATSFTFMAAERNNFILGASFNRVYLGGLGVSTPYLDTMAGEFKWQRYLGPLDNPTGDLDNTFKFSKFLSKRAAATATSDSNAQSFLINSRYNIRTSAPHVYGPGLDIEYRPATNGGTDNSYYMGALVGKWDFPVGPEDWGVMLNQETGFQYTSYYESSTGRSDKLLRYSVSAGKGWFEMMETRAGVSYMKSLSNVSTSRYSKIQFTLTLTAVF